MASEFIVCERVADGAYRHDGVVVCIQEGMLGVAEEKPDLVMFCGVLPTEWFVARKVGSGALYDPAIATELAKMVNDLLSLTHLPDHHWETKEYDLQAAIAARAAELNALLGLET